MRAKRETAVLTVAAIRRRDSRVTEYLFNERQQIFTMPAARKARAQLSTQLTVGDLGVLLDTASGRAANANDVNATWSIAQAGQTIVSTDR